MADRELNRKLFTERRRNKQHKLLRQDPQFRQKVEKSLKERVRELEDEDAKEQIKEFLR